MTSTVMTLLVILLVIVLIAVVAVALVTTRSKTRGEVLDPPAPDGGPTTAPAIPPDSDADVRGDLLVDEKTPVDDVGDDESGVAVVDDVDVEIRDEDIEALIEEETRPTFSSRIGRLRGVFSGYVGSILSRSSIDESTWDDLEEALLRADVGIESTTSLLETVRSRIKERSITTPEELIEEVKTEMKRRLAGPVDLRFAGEGERPTIWLFVGVNGVGKTTTIGKVGRRLTDQGMSVTMAAGDTFRAAAAEQLGMWADRCGADLVRGAEGGDPSSVIFDAVASASAAGTDVVLADTAGRLHTKSNLMDELAKVRRVADKGEGTVTEVLLVIDAVTGQNGLAQARKFAEATDVTGVVLTKLDGSAKGGIVFPIRSELGIPIKLVGLGETALQLIDFDADAFVEALFERED